MIDSQKLPQQAPDFDLRDLLEVGLHFGHQKDKWHPKMSEWIYMEKDGVHIFDLAKTSAQLQLAYNFVYDLASKGKTVIMVGTKRQADRVVEEVTGNTGMMSITSRWLGGLVTNWEQVQKSLKRMLEIEKGFESDAYKNYTKYEQVQLDKELSRLKRFFEGIRDLKKQPDCIIVIDPKRERNAVREARVAGIPVIALTDSNTDPTGIDIVIPGNDDAIRSIKYVASQLVDAFVAGKAGGKSNQEKKKTSEVDSSAKVPQDNAEKAVKVDRVEKTASTKKPKTEKPKKAEPKKTAPSKSSAKSSSTTKTSKAK